MKVIQIIFLLALSAEVFSGNILYLSSVPSPSHFIWCRSILRSLERNGHNITALSPDVEKSTPTMTYLHLEKMYSYIYNGSTDIETDLFKLGEMSPMEVLKTYIDIFEGSCVGSMDSEGYKKLLEYPNDFKFDLVITDNTGGPCLLPFVVKFGYPPILSVTAFYGLGRVAYHTGSPIFPALAPPHNLPYTSTMSFKKRFVSFYSALIEYYFIQNTMTTMDSLVRRKLPKDFPQVPFLGDIEKMAKLFLVNGNHLFDHKEPFFDHIKLVGGAQINDPKPLPKDLQEICDEAKDGFVLFSLGTNVRSENLGEERIRKIIETFKKFPKIKFLWKFEAEISKNLPKNVFIRSWMPQADLLAHPNIKLFITHSGLLSIQEAMWYGVPILGLPVFGDQPQNIIRMTDIGVGKYVNIRTFSSNELSEAIKEILENSRYQLKAKEISTAFRDQPQTPLETATFWAEWVMRNPNINPQNTAALNLSFLARHSGDVIIVSFLVIFTVFIVLIKVFKKLITCIVKFKPKDKKKIQ